MAYRRQEKTLLPGGLSLLPPGDLVREPKSLGMRNFRSNSTGALRSRPKADSSTIGITLTGNIHTIFRAGETRWFGTDAKLYKATTELTSGFDTKPLSMVYWLGYLWVMNRGKHGRVATPEGTAAWETWFPGPPTWAGTLTESTVGGNELVPGQKYEYWVTGTLDDGTETNPADSNAVTISGANNTVTVVKPTHADARVTGWNVYRLGNTLPEPYRVNTAPLSLASDFVDTGKDDFSDLEVTRQGLALETDHTPPPACGALLGPHYGRLLALGSAAYPNRLYWSKINQPWYFPEDNHVDVGEKDDLVNGSLTTGGIARLYLKRSVWRLRGDPADGRLERTNADSGLIGMKALASAGPVDYLQTQEGISAFDGDRMVLLSDEIGPLFRPTLQMPGGSDPDLKPITQDIPTREKACLATRNGRLYFSYKDASGNGHVLTCDLNTGAWANETAPTPTPPAGYTALYDEGQHRELLGAGPLGLIYALELGGDENPTAQPPLRWVSGFDNQGVRERQKTYADLVLEHSCRTGAAGERALTVKLKRDHGDSADVAAGSILVATSGTGARYRTARLPLGDDGLGVEGYNSAVLVEGSCEYPVELRSCTLHFFVEPRDATAWDTRPTDLGDPRVKTPDLLCLDIAAQATVTCVVQTVLPNGGTQTAAPVTFTTPAGRALEDLATGVIRGRLVQVTLTSPQTFRLYAARLRYRVHGLYLGENETWTTTAQLIGG
jgi:hypothetical protein